MAEAQADPDIGEHAAARAVAAAVGEPRAAGVDEHRGSDLDQVERPPVGDEALLEGEQPAAVAVLVAQRVAAQSVVAAEGELVVEVEPGGGVGAQAGEEDVAAEVQSFIDERRAGGFM